jgi:hypothetical protein
MADEAPPTQPATTPPLNLPVGSVRALLTLAVLFTVWSQLLRGREVGAEMQDTLLLVLGYYFGARAVGAGSKADALTVAADRESNPSDPLFLPRGAIRVLIVLGFATVAWKLHEKNALLTKPQPLLILVGTFLLGAIAKGMAVWVGALLTGRVRDGAGHLLAFATLGVVLAYCGAEVAGQHARLPSWAAPTFLGVVGFYLGKR